MASTDAKPVPVKNAAFRITFPILDADGDLVSGATGLDSEVSKDAGTFTDCTNEATELATASGMYYLDLTSTEMNADTVAIQVKTSTSGAKTTTIVLYPQESGDINVNIQSVTAGAITRAGFASDFYQELCRVAYPQFYENIYYVATTGNDSNDGLSPSTAKLTISAAIALCDAGDLVLISSGTFTENSGLNIPNNVSMIGAGRESTIIQSTHPLNSGGGCIVVPGNNSMIGNLKIEGTTTSGAGAYQAPIGSYAASGDKAFTNAYIFNVDTYADSDGFFADNLTTTTWTCDNCIFKSKFDTVAVFDESCSGHFINCVFEARGPTAVSPASTRASAVSCASGDLTFINCDLAAYDATSTTYAIFAEDNAGQPSVMRFANCRIYSYSASGTYQDIFMSGSDIHEAIVQDTTYRTNRATVAGSSVITVIANNSNLQQIDSVATSAMSELTTIPGTSPSLTNMLKWMYEVVRHRQTSTATTQIVYKNDGTTALGTSTVSDDGTTFVRGKFS